MLPRGGGGGNPPIGARPFIRVESRESRGGKPKGNNVYPAAGGTGNPNRTWP